MNDNCMRCDSASQLWAAAMKQFREWQLLAALCLTYAGHHNNIWWSGARRMDGQLSRDFAALFSAKEEIALDSAYLTPGCEIATNPE